MNKLFLTITLLFSAAALHAQSKAELKIGAGIASRPFLKNAGHVSKAGAGGNDNSYYGTYHIEFLYKVLPKVKIGVAAAAEWSKNDLTNSSSGPESWGKHKIYNEMNIALLGTVQYSYINKPTFELYSAASFGPAMRFRKILRNDFGGDEQAEKVSAGYHVSAIGIKFGKRIGGFAELGYGYKGVLSGGAYLRL